MAIATRTLKDTVVNASGAGGKVTVLVNMDDNTTENSNELTNHRLLKNLVVNLNFQESKLNFDNSIIINSE